MLNQLFFQGSARLDELPDFTEKNLLGPAKNWGIGVLIRWPLLSTGSRLGIFHISLISLDLKLCTPAGRRFALHLLVCCARSFVRFACLSSGGRSGTPEPIAGGIYVQ
jgi:hypothetical protein